MKKAIVVSVCAVLIVGSGMLVVAFSHGEGAESRETASFDAVEEGAGIEDSWKNLLEICKDSDFVLVTSVGSPASVELDGECRYSARMICRTQLDGLNGLGEIVRFRLSKIRDFACALKQRLRFSTAEVLRTCYIAVGTGQTGWPGWEKDLDSCLSEADQCQDWISLSCSNTLDAIEFTSRWQQLVEACEVSVDADMEFGRFPAIGEIDSIIRSFISALENSIPTIECHAIAGELCQQRIGRVASVSSVRQLAKSVDTRNSRIQRAACDLHENQSPRAAPVVTTVPEAEVPPSTALPAGTAPETSAPAVTTVPSTTVPEILLRNGVAMVGWDLTVETAEVVDAAVEACSEVFATSIMAGCAAAVWEACYSHFSSYGKMYRSTGITNIEEPELDPMLPVSLGWILCSEAYTAEVVELAMVLAAKYGDRYYSEDTSMPFGEDPDYDLEDFEYDYIRPGGGLFVFAEDVKRDFIYFRMYVDRVDWDPRREIDVGPDRFISDEAHVRIDPLFETLAELQSAFSDSSSGPFEGFEAEKIIAFYSADLDNAQQVIDLPEDPGEIKLFCDEAAYAARVRMPNWVNGVNDCIMAVEDCINKFVEVQHDICTDRLLYDARAELMWKKLPAICAAAEDIKVGDYNDSCRQKVLDLHMLRIGPSIHTDALLNQIDDRLQYHWTRSWNSRYAGMVWNATFFLAQPLIADLPIKYRGFYSLPGH